MPVDHTTADTTASHSEWHKSHCANSSSERNGCLSGPKRWPRNMPAVPHFPKNASPLGSSDRGQNLAISSL